MKFKLSIIALAAAASLMAMVQPRQFTVNVVNAPQDGDKQVCLTSYDSGDTLAVATLKKGSAVLHGTVDGSYFARLIVNGRRVGMVVEPGTIVVDAASGSVTGTPLNKKLEEIDSQIEAIESQAEAATNDFKEGKIDEEAATQRVEALEQQLVQAFIDAYEENRDNGIGPWAFNNYIMYAEPDARQLEILIGLAPAGYRQLERVKKAQRDALAKQLTAEGQRFTDFEMRDAAGKVTRLSHYVGEGHYTLVDFWASWCGPCRREIKNTLKPLHEQYKDKGLVIVGVAVWDDPADTEAAIAQMRLPWPVMKSDHNSSAETDLYGISGIPHLMIIAPDGTIVSRGLQGDDLVAKVQELLQ